MRLMLRARCCSVCRALCALCGGVLLVLGGVAAPARAQEAAGESTGVYVVEEGDTLYRIAREHDLTVERLRRLNDLEGSAIYPGQELRVRASLDTSEGEAGAPVGEEETKGESAKDAPRSSGASFYGAHTAEPGATLYTIAARYGTPLDSLVALNELDGSFLEPGQTVRLPRALGPPTHTVAADETIYDVARRYGVSARLLQRTNELAEKDVQKGQRLRIPGREAPDPQPRGTRRPVRERGPVARYPASYEGRLMAGGARYDPARFTASHPSLPLGTVVLLTNPATGRQTFAQVADRGPLDDALMMDVSTAVHQRLGLEKESSQPVTMRVMD
jgi:LysM repeat protein